jgi:threonine dehydrogenase-like Zn-dependent dehydrogenase
LLAAVFEGNGKLELKEMPKPQIKKGTDVILKVTGIGICGTDLHILQVPPAHPGIKGTILGHEFTGTVAEVGSEVTNFAPGDTVLVDPHTGCGACKQCKRGYPDLCEKLYILVENQWHPNTIGIFSHGAMASHVLVSQQNLYKVSSKVPPYIAVLAEPIACVVNATDKVRIQPGETAVVLGAGPIGLLFVSFLKASGAAKIIVSEISEYRRKAAQACGATLVVDPQKEDLEKVVYRETEVGADLVVEAVGPMLDTTLSLARSSGKIIHFGHDELARPAIRVGEITRKELTIYGAFIGRFRFDRVGKIIESGVLPLDKVVSHKIPLSKVHEGIDLLRQGKAIKVVMYPEE